ncbi:EAL domain-containing protein (putative c-di-GMP-specific phosphodiesterase class I)/NO-binding membrane sensor protein with MHYT domain [Cytobacillus eiseniae]|uniref:EAL domain-containing protein (Putative c-di-GMP-specific phosphodiesterase class I)/NO-binding membrane sensor protein with MHYT domain n=1 Tax=Cytobacillus eiseniae TaxID=762947 RepID=A0ABS4R9P9_9BACI|nr:EAL domain-containing protein [Cytobacillus eiseniae]MBP2239622.1 EAL domain-containing protein (putative c-di-GMP-specific phosphodiesterase class I)/NO-binding membrane sensor protein with MHYT domain [Cytobacillus eiseniae]
MFSPPSLDYYYELNGDYSIPLVILSLLIASLASFTALSMNERMYQNSFFHRNIWLFLASLALGFGIWTMHFVGMSALSLPVQMHYDYFLTFLSIIPSVAASFFAFYIIKQSKGSILSLSIAGIALGVGISTMHYIGMSSMKMDAIFTYNPLYFSISIIIAILVSIIALIIFSRSLNYMKNQLAKVFVSILIGLAISSMHYIGMLGTSFYIPIHHILIPEHKMDTTFLISSVSLGIIFLLSILLLSTLVDRYVDFKVSYFDLLTKLPNRRSYERMLNKGVKINRSIAVWHIHHLEKINTEYGFYLGDQVIRYVVDSLSTLKLPMSELYQLEGNRYALLVQGENRFDELLAAMESIAQKFKEPIVINNHSINLETVCAITSVTDQENPKKLYSDILSVLSSPSIQFQHEIIRFDKSVHTYSFEQDILNSMNPSMEKNEFYLVYQPKIDVESKKIVGLEALIRWNHPEYGFLSPADFIPILEKNQRISDLTDWIIKTVCKQIGEWREEAIHHFQVAINIPGEYLTSHRLRKVLKKALTKNNIEPSDIELEITETSVMSSINSTIRAISTYKEIGFSVALDDFGTGISSLSNLRKMPISTLKIDKSFVDEVPSSEKDSAILESIIALGHSLNLTIVIEGVETKEQVSFLASTGYPLQLQGYYFAKPLIATELIEWARGFHYMDKK